MAVTIKVPTPLRKFTGGQKLATVSGRTVGEALAAWADGNAALQARLFVSEGVLRDDMRVYVGADDIRTLDGSSTSLTDDAIISIIPPVAGA